LDQEYKVVEAAAHVVGRIAKHSGVALSSALVESLGIALLSGTHPRVGYAAAVALGRSRSEEAFYPLLAGLSDDYSEVVAAAAWALGELADLRAVAPLCAKAKSPWVNVRVSAVRALGKLKSGSCLASLVAAVRDPDFEVRLEAVEGLCELRRPEAANALVGAVWDKSSEVSEVAACALVKLGALAVPVIEAALNAQADSSPFAPRRGPAYGRLQRALDLITTGGK
jgi:HEAT repeat protein